MKLIIGIFEKQLKIKTINHEKYFIYYINFNDVYFL
ncbi:MAG: Uncharacterised protein [Polaribacter sp. SA4-10]|nr:MAG: Uncharacterised protein [Polaribacter sp. SA4-10]